MSVDAARRNIRTVAELERDFENKRTTSEAIADGIADFVGSVPFVVVHMLAVAAWVLINTGWIQAVHPFDPYPLSCSRSRCRLRELFWPRLSS